MTKKKKTKKPVKPKPAKELDRDQIEENNFGGFPDRDLKKNLGCG